MLSGSVAEIVDPANTHPLTVFFKFIGDEVMALLIAAVFSFSR